MKKQTLRSEGELFLENFLSNQKIKFKPEKVIRNLKNDVPEYRVADFYLPRYKVYIEFQGLWNNTKDDRERYKEKMRVYGKNKVPCMYLYPENLGIIDYVFHVRMLEALKKFNLKGELLQYKLFRFLRNKRKMLFWFLFFIYSLIMSNEDALAVEGSLEESVYFTTLIVVVVQVVLLCIAFFKYFIKEK